jgi:hypothetical protein
MPDDSRTKQQQQPRPPQQYDAERARREQIGNAIDVSRALDHIDRVYAARMLHLYGLGQVLTNVFDEFDDFMELMPAEQRPSVSVSGIRCSPRSRIYGVPGAPDAPNRGTPGTARRRHATRAG